MEKEKIKAIFELIKRSEDTLDKHRCELECDYFAYRWFESHPNRPIREFENLPPDEYNGLQEKWFGDWDAQRAWLMVKYPDEEQAINDYLTMWQLDSGDYDAILPEYLK